MTDPLDAMIQQLLGRLDRDDEDPRAHAHAVWLRNALPYPAWSPVASGRGRGSQLTIPFPDTVEATRTALGFLQVAGFRPLPDVLGRRLEHTGVLLSWVGETNAVIAAPEEHGLLALLVVQIERTPATLIELIAWARKHSPVVVPFGAFWLQGSNRASLDKEIGGYIDLFRGALGPDPMQADLLRLRSELAAHERRLAKKRMLPWLRSEAKKAWRRRQWALYIDVTDGLADLDEPLDEVRRARAWAQLGDRIPPAAWPPTVEGIRLAAIRLNEAHAQLHSARGDSGDLSWICRLVHARMITDELWDAIERLRAGDPTAVEPALVFLEADPWAFRTGYVKETILERLRRCPLDLEQQARLRAVLLHFVDVGGRREYREACLVAWRVADPAFMDALRERAAGADPGIARRARWMLDVIRPPTGT